VDVAHDVIVKAEDCGTEEGLTVKLGEGKEGDLIFKMLGRGFGSKMLFNLKLKTVC